MIRKILVAFLLIPFGCLGQNTLDVPLNIQEGWNIIGYTCSAPQDVVSALSPIVDQVIIVKDYNGAVYLPTLDYNGIGDFQYGYGYQIKVSQSVDNFQFCPMVPSPTLPYQIGDEVEGGIVFYLDETGQHGLVAATEDLDNDYAWGCNGLDIDGANSYWIGSGLQNTLDIIAEGCVDSDGGISAAQAAFDAEINGYSDWYLPSISELYQIYIRVGNGSQIGNLANFDGGTYVSSSQGSMFNIFTLSDDGNGVYGQKAYDYKVRVVRSF